MGGWGSQIRSETEDSCDVYFYLTYYILRILFSFLGGRLTPPTPPIPGRPPASMIDDEQ